LAQLLGIIKFMSFLWLKVKMLTFAFSYNDRWRHPFIMYECYGVAFFLFIFRCVFMATNT